MSSDQSLKSSQGLSERTPEGSFQWIKGLVLVGTPTPRGPTRRVPGDDGVREGVFGSRVVYS